MRARMLVACCWLASSCASQMADDTVTEDQPIIGGVTDTGDPSVVAVIATDTASRQSLCTGAVIGPRAVLTAAHCVKGQSSFKVIAGNDIQAGKTISVAGTPTFDGLFDPSNPWGGHDVACVRLAQDVGVPALPYNRGSGLGSGPARIVGFGVDTHAGSGFGVKRTATTTQVRSINAGLVAVGMPSVDQCHGDSGGPAFRTIDGQERIIGIDSFGQDRKGRLCVGQSFNTRVDAYLDFIDACAGDPRVVVFGGTNDAQGELNDTWTWDGADWRQLSPPSSPTPRSYVELASDLGRHRLVMFGGNAGDGNNPLGDTWEWDGATWSGPQPISVPSTRFGTDIAFDGTRAVTVLFGGQNGNNPLGDTWAWNGTAWAPQSPGASPSPRFLGTLVFDSARQTVVAFGGLDTRTDPWTVLDDTWEWDGTTWTRQAPAASPPPRYAASAAFDSARGKVVVFGGTDLNLDGLGSPTAFNDTWEWDGTTWTQRVVSGPSGRAYARMAYDPAHQATVLFGGQTGPDLGYQKLNETWTWDGSSWIQQSPATVPPPRIAHGMAFMFE